MKKISIADAVAKLLVSPNVCSLRPVYEKYDKNVGGNTVHERGDAAASVLACFRDFPELDDASSKISVTVGLGGNPLRAKISARNAAEHAITQAFIQIASVGAVGLGATDCLNFGNPEKPDQMAELVDGIDGVKAACEAFSLPIVSGNVSLYNESRGRSIPPSALVAVFGCVDDPERVPGIATHKAGDAIFLLGKQSGTLGGTELLSVLGEYDTRVGEINFDQVNAWQKKLVSTIQTSDLLTSTSPVVSGGALMAVLRGVFGSGKGANITLSDADTALSTLFGEDPAVICTTSDPEDFEVIFGTDAVRLGMITDEARLQLSIADEEILNQDLSEWRAAWEDTMRGIL